MKKFSFSKSFLGSNLSVALMCLFAAMLYLYSFLGDFSSLKMIMKKDWDVALAWLFLSFYFFHFYFWAKEHPSVCITNNLIIMSPTASMISRHKILPFSDILCVKVVENVFYGGKSLVFHKKDGKKVKLHLNKIKKEQWRALGKLILHRMSKNDNNSISSVK